MIYNFLKWLAKLTVYGYFRKYTVTGKENIPSNGPVIFVANHPSAFMDPVVIAAALNRPLHFLAAGEYVGTGIQGWFFSRVLHMIPIFRPSTRPGEAHKNQDSFKKCHEHLGKGGTLIIFPEGVSLTERKLKPLKTGTVRIAIGTQEKFNQQVAIIPVGLNYSDPHAFRSDLLIQVGEPLFIPKKDDQITSSESIKTYTEELETRMKSLILHLPTPGTEQVFEKLDAIFTRDLKHELAVSYPDQRSEFEIQKAFTAAIVYFKQQKPELFALTIERMENYEQLLEKNELVDKDIAEFENRIAYRRIGSFLLGFPFFLLGLVHNYLPYRLSGWLSDKLSPDATFSGSFTLAMGLVLFSLWYTALSLLGGIYLLGWWALLYPVIMYTTGLYALIYLTAAQQSRRRIKLRKQAKRRPQLMEELKQKRAALIALLKGCQEDYMAQDQNR